jgi:hypothetical protein
MLIAIATDLLTRKKMKEMQSDQIAFQRFSQQVIANHDIVLGMGMTSAVFDRMKGLLDRLQVDGLKVSDQIGALTGLSKFLRMFVQVGIHEHQVGAKPEGRQHDFGRHAGGFDHSWPRTRPDRTGDRIVAAERRGHSVLPTHL